MRSLRGRLTWTVLGVASASLVILAVLLFVVVKRTAWQQHDDALLGRARALAAIAEHDDDGYEMSLPPEPVGQPLAYTEVWTATGAVLARSTSLDHDLQRPSTARTEFEDTTLPDGRPGRQIVFHFTPRDEARGAKAQPLTLVLAEGTEAIDVAVSSVRAWFIVIGLATLGALALATSWTLRRGLRPLGVLAAHLEQIDYRRLSDRVPSDGQPEELVVPVRKLNELLARLDTSFSRERQFASDVSHELRTPLSGLRTLLEVTALAERSPAAYVAALASALVAVKQLGTLVENLIALARLEDDELEITNEAVALRPLVEECWRPYAALAESRGLEFTNLISNTTVASTDREKLRIVVSNLLANAAEYTEPSGWILVTQVQDGILEVADSGPSIPAEQLERVFDRLWRGDAARTTVGVHCGIGLSLARAICERLSLSLSVTSSHDRVAFRIT